MRTPLLATLLAATTLLAGCGDDDQASDTIATTASTPVSDTIATTAPTRVSGIDESVAPAETVTAVTTVPATMAGRDVSTAPTDTGGPDATGEAAEASIVSLSPVHTEMLFAIGAGDQVIAVDDQSNYPPEAASVMTDLSGFEPNIEAIAAYEPDLVIVQSDSVQAPLEELGIDVWVGTAAVTLEDAYAQIEQLGAVTGHVAEAAAVVAEMQTGIEAVVESVPELDEPLTVYHELDDTFFSADSTTFIGQVYSQLGLQNIADRAEGDHGGYPQLSAEVIIAADPDLIFLADTKCCGESAETVAQRDGWEAITAVTEGQVFPVDDDVASRWGPRIVGYYEEVAAAVAAATGVPAGG